MANRDQLLVSTDWLAANLDDPNIRVVEVDEDTDAYARGHIPGAVAVNWNTDLQDRPISSPSSRTTSASPPTRP
jgi:thiosulfate/3-mercaptopyruvate sulfurtransferase